VDDRRWLDFSHEPQDAVAIADVEFVVGERPQRRGKPGLVPAGVAGGAEENGPLVVVDAVNPPAEGVEVGGDFAADEARGACDEKAAQNRVFHLCKKWATTHRSLSHDRRVARKLRKNTPETRIDPAHRKLMTRWLQPNIPRLPC